MTATGNHIGWISSFPLTYIFSESKHVCLTPQRPCLDVAAAKIKVSCILFGFLLSVVEERPPPRVSPATCVKAFFVRVGTGVMLSPLSAAAPGPH